MQLAQTPQLSTMQPTAAIWPGLNCVTLAPTDRVSQTIAIADVDFDLKERSRRLDADAKGDFSYLDYLQGAYSSELIGRFDAVHEHVEIIDISRRRHAIFVKKTIDGRQVVTPEKIGRINALENALGTSLATVVGQNGLEPHAKRVRKARIAKHVNQRVQIQRGKEIRHIDS